MYYLTTSFCVLDAAALRARHESKLGPPYFDDADSNGDGLKPWRASKQCGNSVRTQPGVSLDTPGVSLARVLAWA